MRRAVTASLDNTLESLESSSVRDRSDLSKMQDKGKLWWSDSLLQGQQIEVEL